jgi:hypothetical protein
MYVHIQADCVHVVTHARMLTYVHRFPGDNILSINHDSLAHVGNEAVKRKFEEAQRENDSVKLTVLRGGKELKCEHRHLPP